MSTPRLVLPLALLAALVPASAAHAAPGDYTQLLCSDPATGRMVGAPPEIRHVGGAPVPILTKRCDGGLMDGDNGIQLLSSLPEQTFDGAYGELEYTPPAGVRVLGGSVHRAVRTPGNGTHLIMEQHGGASGNVYGLPRGEEWDWYRGTMSARGSYTAPFGAANGPVGLAIGEDGSWRYTVACGSAGRGGCYAPDSSFDLRIFSGRLNLRDDSTPQVNGAPSGSLTADMTLRGSESVTVNASDQGSGIYRLLIRSGDQIVGSRVVDDNGGACADATPSDSDPRVFSRARPCKLTFSGTTTLDTRSLPDGPQEIAVLLEDAAGNRSTLFTRSVTVDNGTSSTTAAGPAADAPSSPSSAAAASTAARRVARLRLRTTGGRREMRVGYGRRLTLAIQALDAEGQEVPGARIRVLQRTALPWAKFRQTRDLRTDARGTVRVATRATSSRTVRFSAGGSAQADVRLRVRPRVGLRITPRRTVNGRSIRLRGSVPGASRRSKALVELQARVGPRWVTFATRRLSKGRFSHRYRFRRTLRTTTYTFRARVRKSTSLPFEGGVSKRVKVRVRGKRL